MELIRRWNERVDPSDIVIHLGDFMFVKGKIRPEHYLSQLNGFITVLKGNHDHHNSFNTRITSLSLEIGGSNVYCVHDPADYNSLFLINLVGHIHDKWKVRKIYKTYLVNVGVDVWNYHPVDINEIFKAIREFQVKRKE
jgi:calcineurin-like phosphoesterase family protein